MKYYIDALKNITNFRGRATRKEYWMFMLFNVIFLLIALTLDCVFASIAYGIDDFFENIFRYFFHDFYLGITWIFIKYRLILLIPFWAITVRRLHDLGQTGWWILLSGIPIIGNLCLFVFACMPSKKENNPYGLVSNKPLISFPQIMTISLIMAIFAYEVNYLHTYTYDLIWKVSESNIYMWHYLDILDFIFFLPELVPHVIIWICWILGITSLQQKEDEKKIKTLHGLAFWIFLVSEVMNTITLATQWQEEVMARASEIFLFVVFLMMFLSVVLRFITLRKITKNTKTFWKVSLSSYLFIPPMIIGYLWRIYDDIFNGFTVLYGASEITTLDYYRVFLMFLMLVAIILLVLSMIVDRKKESFDNELPQEILPDESVYDVVQ